jgi:hypothetical protein
MLNSNELFETFKKTWLRSGLSQQAHSLQAISNTPLACTHGDFLMQRQTIFLGLSLPSDMPPMPKLLRQRAKIILQNISHAKQFKTRNKHTSFMVPTAYILSTSDLKPLILIRMLVPFSMI